MTKYFEIDLPNGKIGKRSSKSRTYSHAVIAQRSYEDAIRVASKPSKELLAVRASNYRHHLSYVDGSNGDLQPREWHLKTPEAKARFDESCAAKIVASQKRLEGCACAADYQEKVRLDALAYVEAQRANGVYEAWEVLGWQSRPDLSQTLAAKYRNRGFYRDVRIVEARAI